MEKIIIKSLSESEIKEKGINNWPIWEKEISTFDWFYDSVEECYIIEGEVNVYADNKVYKIKKGDFVTFSSNLKCKWEIIKPIKKHYNFP